MPSRSEYFPASFLCCYRAASPPPFQIVNCVLFGGAVVPPRNDPSCRECEGLAFAQEGHREYCATIGPISLGDFVRSFVGDNALSARVKQLRRGGTCQP